MATADRQNDLHRRRLLVHLQPERNDLAGLLRERDR